MIQPNISYTVRSELTGEPVLVDRDAESAWRRVLDDIQTFEPYALYVELRRSPGEVRFRVFTGPTRTQVFKLHVEPDDAEARLAAFSFPDGTMVRSGVVYGFMREDRIVPLGCGREGLLLAQGVAASYSRHGNVWKGPCLETGASADRSDDRTVEDGPTEDVEKPVAWPSTAVVKGDGSLAVEDWPQVGLPQHMGYRVGKSGKGTKARRRVLDRVFGERLPRVHSPEYMHKWGMPASAARLTKLADTLAALARNAKRRGGNTTVAVQHWEADLAYLKERYYDGMFDFPWPSTASFVTTNRERAGSPHTVR